MAGEGSSDGMAVADDDDDDDDDAASGASTSFAPPELITSIHSLNNVAADDGKSESS